jgi:hypothetical protein
MRPLGGKFRRISPHKGAVFVDFPKIKDRSFIGSPADQERNQGLNSLLKNSPATS